MFVMLCLRGTHLWMERGSPPCLGKVKSESTAGKAISRPVQSEQRVAVNGGFNKIGQLALAASLRQAAAAVALHFLLNLCFCDTHTAI